MPTVLAQLPAIDNSVWFFALITLMVIVWVAFKYSAEAFKTRQIQQTKREIAAYVAEGSISPDDAVRMLKSDSADLECKIADGVAWGTIKPEKAASLIKSIREEAHGSGQTAQR